MTATRTTKTTRATPRRTQRAPQRRRDPLLFRVVRASLSRYDRRAIGIVTTRGYRLAARLHITRVRARTIGYALLVLLTVAAVLAQASGAVR